MRRVIITPRDRQTGAPQPRRAVITVEQGALQFECEDVSLRQQIVGFVDRFFVPAAGFPKFRRAGGKLLFDANGKVTVDGYVSLRDDPERILEAIRDNFELTTYIVATE